MMTIEKYICKKTGKELEKQIYCYEDDSVDTEHVTLYFSVCMSYKYQKFLN